MVKQLRFSPKDTPYFTNQFPSYNERKMEKLTTLPSVGAQRGAKSGFEIRPEYKASTLLCL
jgi:hypothetical protein